MLTHGDQGASRFRCVGSTAIAGGPAVLARGDAGRGGAGVGCDDGSGQSLASAMAREGPLGPEGSGASGAQAQARRATTGEGGARVARRTRRPRVHHRTVDVAPRGDSDPADDGRAASSQSCRPAAPAARLVLAAARPAGARARRAGDRTLEDAALGAAKKNARRRRAWLLFEDESGVSQQPVVRRTWAPRGETPILTHTGASWKRLSIAGALAFRWDGRRTRFFFQTRPGTYTDVALITFLRALRRHFRRQRVILIWDGLGAHKSGRMRAYLAQQTHWLGVEPLPAYAPDLNPVEPLWGNVKSQEMANVCAPDLPALRRPLRAGLTRVRCRPSLAFAFLRHAGLAF